MVVIVLLALSVTVLARVTQKTPRGWRYPPSEPPLIVFLASRIRFGLGDVFSGR